MAVAKRNNGSNCDTARVALTAVKSIRSIIVTVSQMTAEKKAAEYSPNTQIARGQKQCALSAQPCQRRDEFALGPITALLNHCLLLVISVLIVSQCVLERMNDATYAYYYTSGTTALRRPIPAVYAPWTARLRPNWVEVAVTNKSSENLVAWCRSHIPWTLATNPSRPPSSDILSNEMS
jgi:hypothetical protein